MFDKQQLRASTDKTTNNVQHDKSPNRMNSHQNTSSFDASQMMLMQQSMGNKAMQQFMNSMYSESEDSEQQHTDPADETMEQLMEEMSLDDILAMPPSPSKRSREAMERDLKLAELTLIKVLEICKSMDEAEAYLPLIKQRFLLSGIEFKDMDSEDARVELKINPTIELLLAGIGIAAIVGLGIWMFGKKGTEVINDVTKRLGTGKVGDFEKVKDLDDFLSRIPKDADELPWKEIPGGAKDGVKYKWTDKAGNVWNVRAHSIDPSAPAGSNASKDWIYRVEVKWKGKGKKHYMDHEGKYHRENVMKPTSCLYSGTIANDTHIPFCGE